MALIQNEIISVHYIYSDLVKVLELILVDPCVVFFEEPQRLGQLRIFVEIEVIKEKEEVFSTNRLHLVLRLLFHVLEQWTKNVIGRCVVTNLHRDASDR